MTITHTVAVVAVACLAAAGSIQPAPTFVIPVVGHWVPAVEAEEPIVTANAHAWDGKSGPDLAAIDATLFKQPDPAFAANMHPETAYPLAVVQGLDGFSAGTLRVRFKLIGGESDQTGGLAFGIQPNGDYLFVRYNTKDGNLAIWEFASGKRRVLKHGVHHAQLPLNAWHELTVRLTGRIVTGVMPGGFLVRHDAARTVTGRVGLWTKRDSVTAFTRPIAEQ